MALLNTVVSDIPALTLIAIRLLKRNNIFNTLQYLQEDLDHIGKISKLSGKDQIHIYRDMIKLYRARPVFGMDILYYDKLSTHVSQLDNILEHGLTRGEITEVCGLSGSGKTQLALTLCANICLAFKKRVIYIDTKGDFSGQRVVEIIEGRGTNLKDIALSLECIKVVKLTNMHGIVSFLHSLLRGETVEDSVNLIIVDSLPGLMLQHLGEKSKEGLGLLNQFVNVIRHVSRKYNLAVVVVNLLTRWMEVQGKNDNYYHSHWIETRKPTLGRYWQYIPSISLNLQKSSSHSKIINLSVRMQHYSSDFRTAQLILSSNGVT